tara:strand:+ start:958 stop:1812 length:855 start_codon:yes stop_codon:yes gene_type:complete
MKIFRNLLLILATVFIFELTFTKDANAASCTVTDGVYSADEVNTGFCEGTPDLYEVVIYQLYLCTSSPTGPTTTTAADLDAGGCVLTFNNASGSTASIEQGSSLDLSGTFTRPPDGVYTHGYAKMDNTFGITASLQFDGNVTGQTGGTGIFCATVAGSGTSNTEGDSTSTSVCSTSPLTAGKFVETLEDFGSESFEATGTAENINGTTADITGYLVDTNEYLATEDGDVDKLHGLITFADSVTMNSSVSSITLSFNVGSGMSLYPSGGGLSMGSGPFQAIITAN